MGYKQSVAPFRYSSGESVVATTDAQVNDYGVDFDPRKHVAQRRPPANNGGRDVVVQSTPENRTSDFGVVWYPFPPPIRKREKKIPVALKLKGGGVASTAGQTRGMPSGGMMAGTAMYPLDVISDPYSQPSIDDQNEAAVNRKFVGQL